MSIVERNASVFLAAPVGVLALCFATASAALATTYEFRENGEADRVLMTLEMGALPVEAQPGISAITLLNPDDPSYSLAVDLDEISQFASFVGDENNGGLDRGFLVLKSDDGPLVETPRWSEFQEVRDIAVFIIGGRVDDRVVLAGHGLPNLFEEFDGDWVKAVPEASSLSLCLSTVVIAGLGMRARRRRRGERKDQSRKRRLLKLASARWMLEDEK